MGQYNLQNMFQIIFVSVSQSQYDTGCRGTLLRSSGQVVVNIVKNLLNHKETIEQVQKALYNSLVSS